MSVKSFLKGIESYNDEIKKIMDCFKKASDEGLREVTIPYLIKNTRINQAILYDCMHILIDLDLVDINEYSICPQCYYHNKMIVATKIRCIRCKSCYIPDKIIEKLRKN